MRPARLDLAGIDETLFEDHEELAEITLILSQLTGLAAALTFFAAKRSEKNLALGSVATPGLVCV